MLRLGLNGSFLHDLILYTRVKKVRVGCGRLQQVLTELISWLMTLGLRVSSTKSQLSVFTRANKGLSEAAVKVEGTKLEVSNGFIYLGVYLDERLTWKKHIKEMAKSAYKSINLLRAISKVSWSSHPLALLQWSTGD